jgi:IS30 family transposase
MSQTQRITVTKEQWDEAAEAYELGHQHAAEIARELGVSPATVSREFARRGCVKACRIAETIAKIEAGLDAEVQDRILAKAATAMEVKKAISRFVDEIFDAIDAANRAGEPLGANPEVAKIDSALQLALR